MCHLYFSKYAWDIPLKDKKGITITNLFQKILDESGFHLGKTKKIWVDKGSEFSNRSMKLWLKDNGIEVYSTQNEGKSVVAERFTETLRKKIYKYMTATSTNVYKDKLANIVNKYNNTYHRTLKMMLNLLILLEHIY